MASGHNELGAPGLLGLPLPGLFSPLVQAVGWDPQGLAGPGGGGAGGAEWMLTLHPPSLHPVGLSLPMRTLWGPCPEQPGEGQTGTRLLQPQVGGEEGRKAKAGR